MLHKTIKAAATATAEGKFTAIAAAYTVDRTDEQIQPGAFAKTIARWRESSKMIPVHWDHEGDPESIIGYADPKSMREAEEGLYVRGQLDLDQNEKARAAWRAMKNNSIGLSFGYLVTKDSEVDGIKHLHEIDLFEISITPAPVNPDTRIVSMKSNNGGTTDATVTATGANVVNSAGVESTMIFAHETSQDVEDDQVPGEEKAIEDASGEEPSEAKPEAQDPLRKAYDELALELQTSGIEAAEPPEVEAEPTDEPPSMEELRRKSYDLMLETLIGSEKT